jgi:hypothetical protein
MFRLVDRLYVLALLGLGLSLGLLQMPGASHAQGDRPQPTPDPRVGAAATRYGTRHVVPALAPPGVEQAEGELRVTNAGWLTTTVAIVELAQPGSDPGCEGPATPVIGVTCLEGLGPLAARAYTPSPAASALWAYSLDPGQSRAACRELVKVAEGMLEHSSWASTHWWRGHGTPLAVTWLGSGAAGRAASEGLPATGLSEILGSIGGASAAVLPQVAAGGQARWVNAEDNCLPLSARAGAAAIDETCSPSELRRLELPPLSVFDATSLAATSSAGETSALAALGRGELVAAADSADARGWASYAAGGPRLPQVQQSATTALPLVITPLGASEAQVWVTNQHPTRTAKVSLLMWDGNQAQLVPYRDPLGLCAGATRSYDIRAIAGEIPPTNANRRGDVNEPQPPYLSLRAEAISEDGSTFVPVAAVSVVEGSQGVGAYGGLNLPILAAAGGLRRDGVIRGVPPLVTIVPDVRIGHGPQRISTFLAVMTISPDANAERQALVELYDEQGQSVGEPFRIQMGAGPGGFLDLALVAGRLGARFPNGFRGTAVVRGALNRGAIGVVAMNRPTGSDAPPSGDQVTVHTGLLIARGPDPAIPTATPRPTRIAPTATPARGRMTPTPVEPTPAANAPLLLPYLLHESR